MPAHRKKEPAEISILERLKRAGESRPRADRSGSDIPNNIFEDDGLLREIGGSQVFKRRIQQGTGPIRDARR